MIRSRSLSPAARRVLDALVQAGKAGRHGYDLCSDARVKSGTLYPLLTRLQAQGYLDADWQASEVAGRPPRHVYRLTADGYRFAAANPGAEAAEPLPHWRPA